MKSRLNSATISDKICCDLEGGAAKRTQYKTREHAKADIFDYIERFYNRKRTHSYLDYVSPVQYEKQAVGT